MSKQRHASSILFRYCLAVGAGALFLLPVFLGTPSAEPDSLFFGYSARRVILVAILLAVALSMVGVALKARADHAWAEHAWRRIAVGDKKARAVLWLAAMMFVVGCTGCLTPSYRLPESIAGYHLRLLPVWVWITAMSGIALAVLLVERCGWHWNELWSNLKMHRRTYQVSGFALGIFGLTFAAVGWTGIGLRFREDYWYGAGVPILSWQLLIALMIGAFALWREKASGSARPHAFRLDLAIFLILWLATALLWTTEPLRSSFFLPGPSRPNNEYYPFSDGATFDVYSQFALIGQGLVNGQSYDRALYPSLLVYFHMLGGQNFEQVMAIQAAVFAVLPPIIFLLGQQLHSRAAGIAAGVVTMLRGENAIVGSSWADLASPKMPLTDFPAAICIALITLLVVQWMKAPAKNQKYALWAGGALGLAILLRTHALLLVPFILLWALSVLASQFNRWALVSFLLVTSMVVTTLPWDLRNHTKGSPMFSLYFGRIQSVLDARYFPTITPSVSPTSTPAGYQNSGIRNGLEYLPRGDFNVSAAGSQAGSAEGCGSTVACSIYNNYFHNLVTAVLILPTSPVFHDLRHVMKSETPFWDQTWAGQDFGISAGLFLMLSLALIALGMGVVWARVRFPGLVPVVVFLAYAASNALARTSGGRYVVPMDWVICLFLVIGVLAVFELAMILLGAEPEARPAAAGRATQRPPAAANRSIVETICILAALFSIGAVVPATEWIFPPRYEAQSNQEILAELDRSGLLADADMPSESLAIFLTSPQARLLLGRGLYPRYYAIGDGEAANDLPYAILDYKRLVFSVIGPAPNADPSSAHGVILPYQELPFFPNSADVVVIGCQEQGYVDAYVVFVLAEQASTLVRTPAAPLGCPLPKPVCGQNDFCQ